MNILSLFDGMSCGQIALRELGVTINKYYASEIDKHAIKQTQLNFPDTIQLGDIINWQTWNIDWASIDLILAGSPCQGFSFAGKQLAFDDPRSKLFWQFADILKYVRTFNPNVKFLLENVRMKKVYLQIISDNVGITPVAINPSLVSAQNRFRYYWSNIRVSDGHTDIPQPQDRGIVIKDVLDLNVDSKYYLSEQVIHGTERNNGLDNIKVTVGTWRTYREDRGFRPLKGDKAGTIAARPRNDGSGQGAVELLGVIRRLTPTECARLQTIPDWYKWECADTQQYKMLGNAWTVEVIKHILSFL